ncbi:unnamed protein product [Durusdinium trenchii]|uniref:Uncharacterized protein n=2 Tax=Durusdinium trenchii TaxID=1381693 RepID=A0ABP0JIK6_9DINO
MKLPKIRSRVGQEFVTEPETREEASDEEEDFPYKEWVSTLGRRTLMGPCRSKKQQQVSRGLMEKERLQKQRWQDARSKPRLPVALPVELLALEPSPTRMLARAGQRDRRGEGEGKKEVKEQRIPEVKKESKLPKVDDSLPLGWGRLQDYVNGVRIGPGSLFSHPWDRPTPSGIHPLPKRTEELT